jgi:uncharacterized membrane protein HdeD (DUF308 family)
MNKNILKWIGIGGVIVGSLCLFFSGVGEVAVAAIVGAVFVLAGIIAALFK